MVGFRDLVGTGIAPVSTKTAVKGSQQLLNQDFCVWPAQTLEFHFQGEKWFLIFAENFHNASHC